MPADDMELVRRCQDRDRAAFEELYRRHAGGVYRHLRLLLGPHADAEDALQMVFEQAFKTVARFEGRSSVSTWLHGIAVNVSHNARRAASRRRNAMGNLASAHDVHHSAMGTTPERQAVAREQARKLNEYLGGVSEKKRSAFLLYYVGDLDLSEVAMQVGDTPMTTWARIKRMRADIIKTLLREAHDSDTEHEP